MIQVFFFVFFFFLTQGSNPGLSHYRWILYQLSHKGSPRILEWVAYPFSGDAELEQESQASSRGEAKDSALLSSRDAGLLEPPERPQGSRLYIVTLLI